MRKKIEKHVPCRLSEKFIMIKQLTAQKAAADRSLDMAADRVALLAGAAAAGTAQQEKVRLRFAAIFCQILQIDISGVAPANDDVREQGNIKRAAKPGYFPGCTHIRLAWLTMTVWMVVNGHDRCRIERQRALKDRTRLKIYVARAAARNLLDRQQLGIGVEKENMHAFLAKGS
nr:hypothetical protein [Sphingopyxis sp. MWB1]